MNINEGSGFYGCYATHVILRRNTCIVEIPTHISDEVASTINCAMATAVHSVEAVR